MDNTKLDKWADLLLDTGKRNNLVNFKDAKAITAEIVSPDFSTLLSLIEHARSFEVYDPKLEFEADEADYVNVYDDEGQSFGDKISKNQYVLTYGKNLKKQQVLVYNANGKPINAIKNIYKKASTAIEETGVNIAYLAFGFVNWTESENSQIFLKAPLLLVPISIERESSISPFCIRISDDDIIINPTFTFKLQNEYGVKLPELDNYENVENFLQDVESLISKLKWTLSKECKIGIFSFLKINMYKDIKENADKILKNQQIKSLLGELSAQNAIGNDTQQNIDLLDLHNVVDADSSQAEAVELAKSGKSFVLQGPPGTGKSQTITNIIAECLYDGKKVLFVSEKLAALNVVHDKLKNVGLSEFCLELHSFKANKKQIIEELTKTLKLERSGISDKAEKELHTKKQLQKQLDDYAIELHSVRPIINKTLYRLYEEVSACRTAPDIDFVIQNIKNKTDEYADVSEQALTRYIGYVPHIGYDYHNYVWYGYKTTDCSYSAIIQLKTDLDNLIHACKELTDINEKLKSNYSISCDNLKTHIYLKSFSI